MVKSVTFQTVESVKSHATKPVKSHLVKSDLGRHVARRVGVTDPRRARARARQRPPHTCRDAAVGQVRVTSRITPVSRPRHVRVTSFSVSRPCLALCLVGIKNVQCPSCHAGVTWVSRPCQVGFISESRECHVPPQTAEPPRHTSGPTRRSELPIRVASGSPLTVNGIGDADRWLGSATRIGDSDQ